MGSLIPIPEQDQATDREPILIVAEGTPLWHGPPRQVLWRLLLPGTNTAELAVAEGALAAAFQSAPRRWFWQRPSADEAVALELVGTPGGADYVLRGTPEATNRVYEQLVAGYRQLERERLDPEADFLALAPGEAASLATFHLAAPAALPLKVPGPRALEYSTDPLLGLLHALAATPSPLRVVSQLVVSPAPPGWARPYQRLLSGLYDRRRHFQKGTSSVSEGEAGLLVLFLLGLLALPLFLLHGALFVLWCLFLGLLVALGLAGFFWSLRRQVAEQQVILHAQEALGKLSQGTIRACLRVSVIGPATRQCERERWLKEITSLYCGAYAGTNRLVVGQRQTIRPEMVGQPPRDRQARAAMRDLALAQRPSSPWQGLRGWVLGDRARPLLSTAEGAALFHLPRTADDLPFLALQASQRFPVAPALIVPPSTLPRVRDPALPDPLAWGGKDAVARLGGLYVGTSTYGGQTYPIRFPWSLLDGHVTIVAETGAGKSSLLEQLLRWAFADPEVAAFVLDPHNDFATRLAGLAPPERIEAGQVVILDPTDTKPVGFPTLVDLAVQDPLLQDRLVDDLVATMERLSGEAWGYRVRSNFHLGVRTLLAASLADHAAGRRVLVHTLLDLHDLFLYQPYRDRVLARLGESDEEQALRMKWAGQHEVHSPAQELQETASVINRATQLVFTRAGRSLLGQREPRFSLRQAILERQVCLFRLGSLGRDTRRYVGSLVLGYLQGYLLGLERVPETQRPRVVLAIDELQAFDPEVLIGLFGEVRKFGGRVIAATNSLLSIQQQSPALVKELKSNTGTWIAGRLQAEDARLLLDHLQGGLEGPLAVRDLLTLPRGDFLLRPLLDGCRGPLQRISVASRAARNRRREQDALAKSRDLYGCLEPVVKAEVFQGSWQVRADEVLQALHERSARERAARRRDRSSQDKKAKGERAETPTPDPQDAATAAEAVVRQTASREPEQERGTPVRRSKHGSAKGGEATHAKGHPRSGGKTLHQTARGRGETGEAEEETANV